MVEARWHLMTRTGTVDLLLDERARILTQRNAFEGHLWHAECLLKQIAGLLPRLIAAEPADSVARDSYIEQIDEFLREPRHHPTISVLPGDANVPMASAGDAGKDGQT